MEDNKIYLVRKDGRTKGGNVLPWLVGCGFTGVKELMADGKHHDVYTCVWGMRDRDAKVFAEKADAQRVVKALGNCIVVPINAKGAPV